MTVVLKERETHIHTSIELDQAVFLINHGQHNSSNARDDFALVLADASQVWRDLLQKIRTLVNQLDISMRQK